MNWVNLVAIPLLLLTACDQKPEEVTEKDRQAFSQYPFGDAESPAAVAPEMRLEQKIIWEWTVGSNAEVGYVDGRNNKDVVAELCDAKSEKLVNYTGDGWRIISASPADRIVSNGTCKGREVIIEKNIQVETAEESKCWIIDPKTGEKTWGCE